MLNNLSPDFYKVPYLSSHTPAIAYLSFPFYMEMVGHICTNEGYYLEQEGFEQFFFGITLSGTGSLKYKDSIYQLTENKAFLLDRRDYFKINTCKGSKWDFKWFYFNGTACREYYQLINGKSFSSVAMVDPIETFLLIDKLQELSKGEKPLTDLDISLLITRILTNVIKSKQMITDISAGKSEILKKALDYIHRNYTRSISINELCSLSFTNKSHLIKLFNMYFYTTPYQYIIKLRIEKSKNLLLDTSDTISEISQKCGFETPSLFIDNFKRYTGITPGLYRKTQIIKSPI